MGQRVYLKEYDFNLTAGGFAVILAEGTYFRVQSSTGALSILVDGMGELPGLLAGQGIKDTPFKRLTLRDVSGAANVGKLLVSNEEFIDNRTYGVNSLDTATLLALSRPLAAAVSWTESTTHLANTATVIFLPSANTNGAIIHNIDYLEFNSNIPTSAFLAKNAAPTAVIDGEILLLNGPTAMAGATYVSSGKLAKEVRIAAGKGFYYLSAPAVTGGGATKGVRYTFL